MNKNKTVLITGASSGLGRVTTIYFSQKGWNVVATMRTPNKYKDLEELKNVKCFELDVTKPETIKKAIADTIEIFGQIDVIINNAGISIIGPFEAASKELIEKQFNTNLFGTMNVIHAILPYFRKLQKGIIINITSIGGRITTPLYSLYHGSKFAVEGFSESLQMELHDYNIKIKLVEPGIMKTDFYNRSQIRMTKAELNSYDTFVKKVYAGQDDLVNKGSDPITIAKVIFKAATDGKNKLRYVAGSDARLLLKVRRLISQERYYNIFYKRINKARVIS